MVVMLLVILTAAAKVHDLFDLCLCLILVLLVSCFFSLVVPSLYLQNMIICETCRCIRWLFI